MKIGIIGYGYVGSAVAASYPDQSILINDPKMSGASVPVTELKNECDAIYVCVPTPQMPNGDCDTSVLEEIIRQLVGYSGIVIAKSTASPRVYRELEELDVKLAHVPEFLTQARAKYDYVNPHKIVVGCKPELRKSVADILLVSAINFNRVNIEYCSIEEASFFKYMANTMLAMKVIMNNEFRDMAQALHVNWDNVTDIARTDYRLGSTHWQVPGPDGSRGFGGACFPKDTAALASIARFYNIDMSMLFAAIDKNKKYRV